MADVTGEHTVDKDGNIICKCGKSNAFKMTFHIDFTDRACTTYVCQNCRNVIGVTVHREMC